MRGRVGLVGVAVVFLVGADASWADTKTCDLQAALAKASPTGELFVHAESPSASPSMLSVLPGGQTMAVDLSGAPTKSMYVACFVDTNEEVPVLEAVAGSGQQSTVTTLTLRVPSVAFGRPQERKLIVGWFTTNDQGQRTPEPAGVAVAQVDVTNGGFAFVVAVLVVALAYLVAVLALGRIGKKLCFDPVFLTSGTTGMASLSQLQIFGFTLLVLGLLVFALLRTATLCDISPDILLLLGISAAGTAGTKVAGVTKKRLSFDNWAWLRNRGWLTAFEAGCGQEADRKRARWGDLLKTCGTFDVYSFQLATVSIVVGASMAMSDLTKLASFTIPHNLLGLLGLSNVVYIGGKAVDPNSVGELDEKVGALRTAEKEWFAATAVQVAQAPDKPGKERAARDAAPDKYATYITTAREVARMMKTLYRKDGAGSEGTKFTGDIINDADLMPQFP
jgi:hypothetical protein